MSVLNKQKPSSKKYQQLQKFYFVISFLLISGYLSYMGSTWLSVTKQIENELENINKLFVQSVNSSFQYHESMLRIMGLRFLDINALEHPERGRKFVDDLIKVNPTFAGFGLAEPSGQLVLVSGVPADRKLPNLLSVVESSSTFLEVYDTKSMVTGRTYYMTLLEKWLIPIRISIRDSQNHIALVNTAGIDIRSSHAIWNAIELPPDMRVTLIRKDGYIQLLLPVPEFDLEAIFDEIYVDYDLDREHQSLAPDPTDEDTIAVSDFVRNGSMRVYTSYPQNHIAKVFRNEIILPSLIFGFAFIVILLQYMRTLTHQRSHDAELLGLAHFDSLTKLPNRTLILDRLNQLLEEAKRSKKSIALLFIDLDEFKKVNDSLGHEAGDIVLIQTADRLKSIVRSEDTVGRLAGDEFIILLGGINDEIDVIHTANKVIQAFRKPHFLDQRKIILTVSIGISIYPDDGNESSTLLGNADTAMYYSKNNGKNTYHFFTQRMNEDMTRRLRIEEELSTALQISALKLYYQPIVGIKSGQIVGLEALLRWQHPTFGYISPEEFVPIAEKSGLIIPIGRFVIDQSIATLAKLQDQFNAPLKMAINLSPRQFRDSKFLPFLKTTLETHNIASRDLEFEITEGFLLDEHSHTNKILEAIRSMDITLSMDDFGTGYSSLSYLHNYPFDKIKIDRSFVFTIDTNNKSKELVATAILMAQNLGIKIIAEGVETENQLTILSGLNCDSYQGYLFSKPVPIDNIVKLLKAQIGNRSVELRDNS